MGITRLKDGILKPKILPFQDQRTMLPEACQAFRAVAKDRRCNVLLLLQTTSFIEGTSTRPRLPTCPIEDVCWSMSVIRQRQTSRPKDSPRFFSKHTQDAAAAAADRPRFLLRHSS